MQVEAFNAEPRSKPEKSWNNAGITPEDVEVASKLFFDAFSLDFLFTLKFL